MAAAQDVSPAVSSVMEKLSSYMAGARNRALPDNVERETKHHILDTIAAMVSGSDLPPGRMAIQFARSYGGEKIATVVASQILCGPIEAAFANGELAHSDETDDDFTTGGAHPGCAVVPAALATGEQFGISGAHFLRATALGYALVKPYENWLSQDYFIFQIQQVVGVTTSSELLSKFGQHIAQIVRGEIVPLSKAERSEVLQSRISYYQKPAPKIDGAYHFEILAHGRACGGTFERYATFSRYIGPKPDRKNTVVTVSPAGPFAVTVSITPRDANKKVLGPGFATSIRTSVRNGNAFPVTDRGDGSYVFRLVWKGSGATPQLRIKIGDFETTVSLTKFTRAKPSFPERVVRKKR